MIRTKKIYLLLLVQTICIAAQAQRTVHISNAHWKRSTLWDFSCNMTLYINERNKVTGDIVWQINSADPANEYYWARKGSKGTEHVSGIYSPSENALSIEGVSKTDPDNIINMDEYELDLLGNGTVDGRSKGADGKWLGRISGKHDMAVDARPSASGSHGTATTDDEDAPAGSQGTSAQEWFKKGMAAEEDNDHGQAIRYFTEAIRLRPEASNLAKCYYQRGICYSAQGRHEQAISDYNRAIELDPNKATFYEHRGSSYGDMKRYEEAISDYTKAMNLDPKEQNNHALRAIYLSGLKRYDEAIADYTHAIKLDPKTALLYRFRGECYEDQKKYAPAIADYSKAIQLNPRDTDSYHSRGGCYYELDKYALAIADYTKVIRMKPNSSEDYHYRGDCYTELKKYDAALKDLNMALMLDPSNEEVRKHIEEVGNNKQGYVRNGYTVNSYAENTSTVLGRGDRVIIEASGAIVLGAFSGAAGPDGKEWANLWTVVPSYLYGALLYKIGEESQWHLAGSKVSFTAPSAGKLKLRVNDTDPTDNSGTFSVNVFVAKKK